MTTVLMAPHTSSTALTTAECLERLGTARTGHVAVVAGGRSEVIAVSHVYDEQLGRIVFPVDVAAARSCWYTWPWASFEADGCDEDGAAWVVVATGELLELEYRDDIDRLSAHWPERPPFDGSTRWMSLSIDQVTGGRRTHADAAKAGRR